VVNKTLAKQNAIRKVSVRKKNDFHLFPSLAKPSKHSQPHSFFEAEIHSH